MKLKRKAYPFVATAESKTSQAGNNYVSIGLGQTKKLKEPDENGNEYATTWLNMIDERDLLVLATICQNLYTQIVTAKNKEREGQSTDKPAPQQKPQQAPQQDEFDDDIPF